MAPCPQAKPAAGSWAVKPSGTALGFSADSSEDWESLAPPSSRPTATASPASSGGGAAAAGAAAGDAKAAPKSGVRVQYREYGSASGDATSSSSGDASPARSIGDDDLGWGGDEGSLDDFELDVNSLVVPQVRGLVAV